jgi:hypothetical protein
VTNVHPLDDVRGLQEEHKSPWPMIVREHLNRTLVKTGYVSAEDFDALGIPPEHSNLANAQMGAYSRMGYMEKVSWHRSKKPSRKSGTVWTHRITEKGRQELSKLVGIDAGGGSGRPDICSDAITSVDPGESKVEEVGSRDGTLAPSPDVGTPASFSPDPLRLFDYNRPEAA